MLVNGVAYRGLNEQQINEVENQLMQVYDPDIGIDIINLGLVYDIELDDSGDFHLKMSLTSQLCNCRDSIFDDIRQHLAPLDYIESTHLDLVWEPKWQMTRITRFGRIALGINPN